MKDIIAAIALGVAVFAGMAILQPASAAEQTECRQSAFPWLAQNCAANNERRARQSTPNTPDPDPEGPNGEQPGNGHGPGQNNGHGNGDQDAPGNSGGHNNAENSGHSGQGNSAGGQGKGGGKR